MNDWTFTAKDFDIPMPLDGQPKYLANVANNILAKWITKAPVVWNGKRISQYNKGVWSVYWSEYPKDHTLVEGSHTARLVCIEPIVHDTAEGLLRELVEAEDMMMFGKEHPIITRARAVLKGGGDE